MPKAFCVTEHLTRQKLSVVLKYRQVGVKFTKQLKDRSEES